MCDYSYTHENKGTTRKDKSINIQRIQLFLRLRTLTKAISAKLEATWIVWSLSILLHLLKEKHI